MPKFHDFPNVIRPRNITAYTALSRTTIWRLERAGDFPKRVRLSSGAVGWYASDVQKWLESRQTVLKEG